MARADIHLIESNHPPASDSTAEGCPRGWNQRKRDAWSSAFFDLEKPIEDLLQMALIAVGKIHDTIGELTLENGIVVDGHLITDEAIASTVFSGSHLVEMIEAMEANYQRVLSGKYGDL